MFGLRYLRHVVTLQLDDSRCNGCQMCTIVCPHDVFAIVNKRAVIADRDHCMECGACARNCPEEAIKVTAGVGCAAAIITGALRGTEPVCECSDDSQSCC